MLKSAIKKPTLQQPFRVNKQKHGVSVSYGAVPECSPSLKHDAAATLAECDQF